jgi:hypothetical protein
MTIRKRAKAASGSHMQQTLAVLDEARKESPAAIVFYSGGKDSRAVLDLASRTFERIVLVFMYFVKGLSCCEGMLHEASVRYGAEVRQYPHWCMTEAIRNCVYCNPHWTATGFNGFAMKPTEAERKALRGVEIPVLSLRDIYDMAKADTGIPVILHGAKRCDSTWRRRNMQSTEHWADVYYPIAEWSKHDVKAFLTARGIPIPVEESAKTTGNGIGLTESSLVWLHENHPDDFKKVAKVFPYCEAVLRRRLWYPVEAQA